MQAVAAMMQGARQRDQVLHRLAFGQRLDFDRAVAPARRMAADRRRQRDEVAARAHQHGDLSCRIGAPLGLDHGHHAFGFELLAVLALAGLGNQRMHRNAGIGQVFARGDEGPVADLAAQRFVMRREERRKAGVDPVHHRRTGAVVARQTQRRQRQAADALCLGAQEQPHLSLAEAVDRLHRIADAEQRAAVAWLPAGGEALQQLDLGRAGVLELVDQQVADAPVEAQAQFRRVHVVAQGGDGARGELAEIHFAGLAEHQPQLGRGELHQSRQGAHDGVVLVLGRRQAAQAHQGGDGIRVEARQRGKHGVLLRFDLPAGGEAVLDVDRLARGIVERQQEGGQRAPARQILTLRGQGTVPVGERAFPQVGRGKTRQRHPWRLPGRAQRLHRAGEFLSKHLFQRRGDRRFRMIKRGA